jgi:hypothetical protein
MKLESRIPEVKVFRERQYFRQTVLWLFLIVQFLLLLGMFLLKMVWGIQMGNYELSQWELLLFLILISGFCFLFYIMHLETRIDEDGVHFRYFPFQTKMKTIEWNRVQSAFVRKYSPLWEYGGWGLRVNLFGKGGAYNVSGNYGLQLKYDQGVRFLIGTGRPEELEEILISLKRLSNEAK